MASVTTSTDFLLFLHFFLANQTLFYNVITKVKKERKKERNKKEFSSRKQKELLQFYIEREGKRNELMKKIES